MCTWKNVFDNAVSFTFGFFRMNFFVDVIASDKSYFK